MNEMAAWRRAIELSLTDADMAKLKSIAQSRTEPASRVEDAVARLVGIEGGVVSGGFNLESSGVEAPDWRPRHDQHYHEVRLFAAYSRDGCASFRRLV